MVKNVSGGSKSKGMARKFAAEPRSDKLVLSTCADERYAVVTNIYGGDRCAVITDNALALQCVIRKKFRGRHRRGNLVAVGCYVLVGLRDYEAPSHRVCDLLEVYSKDEADRLNRAPGIDTAALERCAAAHNPAGAGASGGKGEGEGFSGAHIVFSSAAHTGHGEEGGGGVSGLSGSGSGLSGFSEDFCVDDI